jgi:phosphotransferase system HPr-like phosphotransfer protein
MSFCDTTKNLIKFLLKIVALLKLLIYNMYCPKTKGQRRILFMKSVKITLAMAEHVKQFVNTVSKYPYDIDLRSGRFLIDAKSLLGIFSLDLSKPLVLEIHNDNCADLLEDLKPFLVK